MIEGCLLPPVPLYLTLSIVTALTSVAVIVILAKIDEEERGLFALMCYLDKSRRGLEAVVYILFMPAWAQLVFQIVYRWIHWTGEPSLLVKINMVVHIFVMLGMLLFVGRIWRFLHLKGLRRRRL